MQSTPIDKHVDLIIVATSAKTISARPNEKLHAVKLAALREFGISPSQAEQYKLATSPGAPAGTELDEDKTVSDYGFHDGSRVFLIKPHNDA